MLKPEPAPGLDGTNCPGELPEDAVLVSQPPTRKVGRDTLVNRINSLSFQERPLTVLFAHRQYGQTLSLPAIPEACTDALLHCRLQLPLPPSCRNDTFRIERVELTSGEGCLSIALEDARFSDTDISGRLAEVGFLSSTPEHPAISCRQLAVRLIQNSCAFTGYLESAGGTTLALNLEATPPQNFNWLDPSAPATLMIDDAGTLVLATGVNIVCQSGTEVRQTVTIVPRRDDQRRYPARKHRTRRVAMTPSPTIEFNHPLTGERWSLDVADLSGTGLSVDEPVGRAGLFPGLQLKDVALKLSGDTVLPCQAQVVYSRTLLEKDRNEVRRCGLAILDMATGDHTRLLALVHRATDRRRGVSTPVEIDRLWEFFFSSGFIYPEKYRSLHEHRAQFQDTYTRLYNTRPEFARHFIIQERGKIAAHIGMLRTQSNSWLIQHHAADHACSSHAGLDVLQLAGEVIGESHSLHSAHMQYVMCYFRPENRFPQRMFGGVANHYRDPSRCSVDTFAYFHYRKELDLQWKDQGPWALTPAQADDFNAAAAIYGQQSGGLMLKCLDLSPVRPEQGDLAASYLAAGFSHQQNVFALRHEGIPVAIFSTLRTAFGLNLSNLTNAITVVILDPERLPREAYFTAISMLAAIYPAAEVPVLTYPDSYPETRQVAVEKRYSFWAVDCRNLDPYFDFCEQYFRRLRTGKSPSS